jgi:non-specific serine/threonine protein kinase
MVFELVAGKQLFPTWWSEWCDDNLCLTFGERLGPLPDELYQSWDNSSKYYNPDRQLYNCELGGVEPGGESYMFEQVPLEKLFDERTSDLSEEVVSSTIDLIRSILKYDPDARPSAREVLKHSFFQLRVEKPETFGASEYANFVGRSIFWMLTCRRTYHFLF